MEVLLEFDPDKISEETKTKLINMCKSVYKKEISQLTKKEVMELVRLDLAIFPSTFNIYVSGKRKMEVQFNMNDYSAGMTFNLEAATKQVAQVVSEQPTPEAMVEKFVQMRGLMYSLLTQKYATNEEFLRHLCRQAEIKDGIPGCGRHK